MTDAIFTELSWVRSLRSLSAEDAPFGGPGLAALADVSLDSEGSPGRRPGPSQRLDRAGRFGVRDCPAAGGDGPARIAAPAGRK